MSQLSFEDLVLQGIEARQKRDGAQWQLGDLALQVETSYGGHTLQNYAESIGVEYGTLRRYRDVAGAYGSAMRIANLSFYHHQSVAANDDRIQWLEKAAAKNWSVRQMMQAITEEAAKRDRIELPEIPEAVHFSMDGTSPEEASIEEVQSVIEQAQDLIDGFQSQAKEEVEQINSLAPQSYNPETDQVRMRRRMQFFRAVEELAELPDPEEVAADIPDYQAFRLEQLERAAAWLSRFIAAWRERHATSRT